MRFPCSPFFLSLTPSGLFRPEALVGTFSDREELRVVRRDDFPDKETDDTNWGAPRELSFWTITTKG